MGETQRRQLAYVDPIRRPRGLSAGALDIRAWILLAATLVLPGSVQSIFRSRRARLALGITLGTWALALLAGLLVLLWRSTAFTFATNPIILVAILIVLAVAGANWLLCLLDTLRRVRLHTLSRRARPRFIAAALVAALVVCGGTAYVGSLVNSQRQLVSELFASGLGKRPTDGRYNILLLGSDAGKGRVGIRPDSISLVSVDAKTGAAVTIGMPRNMQNVPFAEGSPLAAVHPNGYDCGDECLLNAVYQEGEKHADEFDRKIPAGAQAMKDAVTGITGLEVHYYAMIDLQGFEQLIDAMGGITLTSGKRVPISGKYNAATKTYAEPKGWIEPGKQKLDGYHALWFARSREGASDYERMVRQRCVQQAMVAQLDPATLITRFQDIAKAAPEVVSTDVPQLQVDDFVNLALKTRDAGTSSLNLTPPRVVPHHPDFAEVHSLVDEAIAASEEDAQALMAPEGARLYAAGAGGGSAAGGLADAAAVPVDSVLAAPQETSSGEGDDDAAICTVP